MGFFDGAALGSIAGPIGTVVGGAIGGGAFGDSQDEINKRNAVEDQRKKTEDARIQAQGAQQSYTAQGTRIRSDMPSIADSYSSTLADQRRQQLAQSMQNNTNTAQSRGLLYSGLKQGSDAQSVADYAKGNAQDRYGINNALENQAQSMEGSSIKSGLGFQSLQQQAQQQAYQNALTARQNKLGEAQSVAGPAGSLFGGLLGGQFG